MDLGVRDAAKLLKVSEKTIYRWLGEGKLPSFKIREQYRFNRVELLEWATSKRLNVSADIFKDPPHASGPLPSVTEALRKGGIGYRVGGNSKQAVLRAIVELIPLPEEVDHAFLLQVLLVRESLGSTGIGNGIAIPHARNPIVLHVPRPILTLSFLERPVEFKAIDGRPVHTLFTILSPTVRGHLHLLSRLSFMLRDPEFMEVIQKQGSRESILDTARRVETRIQAAPALPPAGEQA